MFTARTEQERTRRFIVARHNATAVEFPARYTAVFSFLSPYIFSSLSDYRVIHSLTLYFSLSCALHTASQRAK